MSADGARAILAQEREFYRLFLACTANERGRFVATVLWPDMGKRGQPTDSQVRRMVRSLTRAAERELAGESTAGEALQ